MAATKRLIVGISGATGIPYAVRALEFLKKLNVETHLVISRAAELTRELETDLSSESIKSLATKTYSISDVGACIASGSLRTDGMIIIPCSVKTVGEIASGATSTLLARAADVTLKERRKLVLVVRETPFNAIHLRNMLTLTECGGIIHPPMPAFYQKPQTIDDIVNDTVGRALMHFDLDVDWVKPWGV